MATTNLPTGIRLLGVSLTLVGAITLVMLAAGVALGRDVPAIHSALAVLYGATSLTTGLMLLRRQPGARVAYLVWSVAIGVYVWEVREYLSVGSIPGIVLLLALLGYGFHYIANHGGVGGEEGRDRTQ